MSTSGESVCTPATPSSDLLDKHHALLFSVRRSIRYHRRRGQFFDRLNTCSTALSLLFSSATLAALFTTAGPVYVTGAAVLVTVSSTVNLVIGTSRMVRLHEDLARRFIRLEQQMMQSQPPREEDLTRWTRKRLAIEADEPPISQVLDVLCYNEEMRAEGYAPAEFAPVGRCQRFFAQVVDIGAHRINLPPSPPPPHVTQ